MSKTTLLATVALIGAASNLVAQFNPLPDAMTVTSSGPKVDAYAQLIESRGWNIPDTSSWTTPAPTSVLNFDPFGTMDIVFISESANSRNDFGIHLGTPGGHYNNESANAENSQTIFHAMDSPNSIGLGHFVTVELGGMESFDFWLSAEVRRTSPLGGITSLFHPDFSGEYSRLVGMGTSEEVGSKTYHLFALLDPEKEPNDPEANALTFFVSFSGSSELGRAFTPVPEPSVYGAFGALLLAGLILRRRLSRQK